MTELEKVDVLNHLSDDIIKIKFLAGDLTESYLPMVDNPLNLPRNEYNEFIKKLGRNYHRYSIIAELLFDNILKIEDRVNSLIG